MYSTPSTPPTPPPFMTANIFLISDEYTCIHAPLAICNPGGGSGPGVADGQRGPGPVGVNWLWCFYVYTHENIKANAKMTKSLSLINHINCHFTPPSVDYAATCAHGGIMYNHGQNCCAGSRTFVQDTIYEKFVEKSLELAQNRKVGDPFDALTQQGPLVS